MPNITLAIPTELKRKMDQFKEINWSEVARQAIWEKTIVLEKMNHLLSKSELTTDDIVEHSSRLKRAVLKKHKAA